MYGSKSIILIGPIAVGKTTLANHLQHKYGLEIFSGDDLIYKYMSEHEIATTHFLYLYRRYGADAALSEFENVCAPFISQLLTDIFARDKLAIVDFGGNQTLFRDKANFEMVKTVMNKFDNSFLLLPHQNVDKSLSILFKRFNSGISEPETRIIINSDCNQKLAKNLIYIGEDVEDIVFNRVDAILHNTPEMDQLLNEKATQKILSRKR